MILMLALVGAAVYAMFTRKRRCMEYKGRLKASSSSFHSVMILYFPLACLMSLAGAVISFVSGRPDLGLISLVMVVAFGAAGFVYYKLHLRKLAALVPEQSAGKTLVDQLLIGMGTILYTLFCCSIFFTAFFGVPIFVYNWD